MWRFLLPTALAVPLLWTVVAEWRLVVSEPAPSGGTNALPTVSTEKCGLNPGDVDAAEDGYRKWAALALRIDDGPLGDDNTLKSPWKELQDHTKKRVESLRQARRFTERYREGKNATPGDPDVYKRALEERAIDFELLRQWHESKRVEDTMKLRTTLAKSTAGGGEAAFVINGEARAVLDAWITINEVLNASPREKGQELLVGALNHVTESAQEKPFTREDEDKIDRIVGELTKCEKMTSTHLGELPKEARRRLPYWTDLQSLKKDVNSYRKLADKVRGVAAIAEKLMKDHGVHEVTLARLAAEALCRKYLPLDVRLMESAAWKKDGLNKLRDHPRLGEAVRVILVKSEVFRPE